MEWSNVIAYEMGYVVAGVYTMAKAFVVENIKHGWKMTWLPTWQQIF